MNRAALRQLPTLLRAPFPDVNQPLAGQPALWSRVRRALRSWRPGAAPMSAGGIRIKVWLDMAPLAMISERPSSVRSMVKPEEMSSTTPFFDDDEKGRRLNL